MRQADQGRFLPRAGRKVGVSKAEATFTAIVEDRREIDELEARDEVAAVVPLTPDVVRVRVEAEEDELTAVRDELMDELRTDADVVVHHEYVAEDDPATAYQITDEIIAEFTPEIPDERIAEIVEQHGLVIKKEYPKLGKTFLLTVTTAAGVNPVKVANRLEELDEVVYAEPALVNRLQPFALPTDEQLPAQWHLSSEAAAGPDVAIDADASVVVAWGTTMGSRDVVVAVLDDGFDLDHPDFRGVGKVVQATDFVSRDVLPYPEGDDYHGTPCAGVAIAEANGTGCVGVAPRCAFMPVRLPLNASDPWLIEIFEFVSARANIASCSWGMPPGDYPLHSAVHSTFSRLARTGGRDGRGLTIVFAAGNYDAPLDARVDYPIQWSVRDSAGNRRIRQATGRIVNGYAAHADVVAVSACSSLNRKALYSNWGSQVTVAAPSNDFHPVTMQRLAGRGITTTDNETRGSGFTPGKRYTNSFGGTSSATPLVAGVAALVKSANPALRALEIKSILEATADKIVDNSTDPLYGHRKGVYAQGRCDWFGFGRVNAAGAVASAVERLPNRRRVEVDTRPRLEIPDDYLPGVASPLEVDADGVVAAAEVWVEVDHGWIGDLDVALAAPDGARVPLHTRTGGSRDDIRRWYSIATTPALGELVGKTARGRWTLVVSDRSGSIEGTLERWRLRLDLSRERRARAESTEAISIPDDDTSGVVSSVVLEEDGAVRDVAVTVEIAHEYARDLRVELVAPDGRNALLYAGNTGPRRDLRTAFDLANCQPLVDLLDDGLRSRGTWQLRVSDVAARDVGALERWSLEVELG